jgi:hypothetical protein
MNDDGELEDGEIYQFVTEEGVWKVGIFFFRKTWECAELSIS